ncbi:MAG TPA: PLP-dependent aminotransferase family protein [Anaerolineales bacterium]|nr:PLP-dependent aminotransferase family protein [Anaerolineales bacterium]
MGIFKGNPFQPASNAPLYQALYAHMRAAILSGELKDGMKLPSTRALADELNISRNTVLNAYRQLLAEGYLESRGGSGTFVAHILPDLLLTAPQPPQPKIARGRPTASPQPFFSKRAQAQIAVSQSPSASKSPRPFMPEAPALDVFPYQLWSRLVVRQARRMPASTFLYQDSAGYRPLREAIAAHVSVSRQVHCVPEQVMIVPGSQGALDLAARMLINPGDPVWLEDPGYPGARGAFLGAGAQVIPVPIDEEGLMVNIGMERAPEARLVYLTPSHQFPLGVTMSLARRLALLDWVKRANAYVIEDDYDSEFRFASRPLATLQGLDDADRVIYIGTFSKVLFPSMRVGYMILPSLLVDSFLKVRRLIDIHSPMLEQAVLTNFITEGHFRRHLRRMRTLYAERRNTLLNAARELPLMIDSPEAGIHCVGWLPEGMDDWTLVNKAADYDLNLTPISSFSIEPLPRKGLLLGYGGFSVREIKEGVRRLGALLGSA